VPCRMHLLSPHDAPDTRAEDWPGCGVGWRLFYTRPPGHWSLTSNDDAHLQMRLTPPREWPLGRQLFGRHRRCLRPSFGVQMGGWSFAGRFVGHT
jgi:hypothetical protein